ncbi:hypothetical protein PVK06_044823 [Gossypium arboreum]|uniref:Reverse transcriptase n=1 Tax=Gossypium arboreum TaxID=29729 RepID=A0ABR0MSB1_GOSAR|nr:hypothetical protein PVK06_044823 [Gossypium arboreum]
MKLGAEVAIMGWDLSLRVQSKRALAMKSIWLRENGKEASDESLNGDRKFINGVDVDPDGSRGGLCLAWKDDVSITLQSFSKRHIDVFVDDQNNRQQWRFTGFYGSLYAQGRDESWNLLRGLRSNEELLWLVYGDFNEIMYDFEKKGGIPREERRMEVFRNALEDCRLMDIGYSRKWFTWERENLPETNIRERLDRGVANENWMSMFPEVTIQHLVHSTSDYCPLLITINKDDKWSQKNFKFEAWWVLEESFEAEVKFLWEKRAFNFKAV